MLSIPPIVLQRAAVGAVSHRAHMDTRMGVDHRASVMAVHVVRMIVYVHHRRGQTGSDDRCTRYDADQGAEHRAHCPPLQTVRQGSSSGHVDSPMTST